MKVVQTAAEAIKQPFSFAVNAGKRSLLAAFIAVVNSVAPKGSYKLLFYYRPVHPLARCQIL